MIEKLKYWWKVITRDPLTIYKKQKLEYKKICEDIKTLWKEHDYYYNFSIYIDGIKYILDSYVKKIEYIQIKDDYGRMEELTLNLDGDIKHFKNIENFEKHFPNIKRLHIALHKKIQDIKIQEEVDRYNKILWEKLLEDSNEDINIKSKY